jgi:hypothetical protein
MTSQPPNEPRRSDHLVEYLKTHTREIIAYILLILGILLLFVDPIWGGLLVGLVGGVYFGDSIVRYFSQWKAGGTAEQATRNLIGAGVAVAFFISAPAIFLGAAIAIGIKQLFVSQSS